MGPAAPPANAPQLYPGVRTGCQAFSGAANGLPYSLRLGVSSGSTWQSTSPGRLSLYWLLVQDVSPLSDMPLSLRPQGQRPTAVKVWADNTKGSEDNTSKKLLEPVKFRSQCSKRLETVANVWKTDLKRCFGLLLGFVWMILP